MGNLPEIAFKEARERSRRICFSELIDRQVAEFLQVTNEATPIIEMEQAVDRHEVESPAQLRGLSAAVGSAQIESEKALVRSLPILHRLLRQGKPVNEVSKLRTKAVILRGSGGAVWLGWNFHPLREDMDYLFRIAVDDDLL